FGVVTRLFERFMCALEEEPVLGVDQLGLARRVVEEGGVEELLAVDHPTRLDVARVAQQRGLDPRGQQLLVAEAVDAVHTVPQVLPELLDVARAREASRHADDRDPRRRTVRGAGWGRRAGSGG